MSGIRSFTGLTAEVVGVAVDITDVIADAISLSEKTRLPVTFNFNGVDLTVHGNSNPKDVFETWYYEMWN